MAAPGALHAGEHRDEGEVDLLVHLGAAVFVKRFLQTRRKLAHTRRLSASALLDGFHLGERGAEMSLAQLLAGVGRSRRVQNVGGKPHVEAAQGEKRILIDERVLARIAREDAMERLPSHRARRSGPRQRPARTTPAPRRLQAAPCPATC